MTTNINDGKKLYASFSEAEKVAEKMSRTHNEGFNVYKVEGMWAVGGVHLRKNNKQKIKSFLTERYLIFHRLVLNILGFPLLLNILNYLIHLIYILGI